MAPRSQKLPQYLPPAGHYGLTTPNIRVIKNIRHTYTIYFTPSRGSICYTHNKIQDKYHSARAGCSARPRIAPNHPHVRAITPDRAKTRRDKTTTKTCVVHSSSSRDDARSRPRRLGDSAIPVRAANARARGRIAAARRARAGVTTVTTRHGRSETPAAGHGK